ncbi:patatin-like phospholipase family protein [Nocardioides humi]|uniref:PNPLA domain-containing protein n=1 Tax=Nocardioides humi TaxID=449461 RepID=A0ABN2AFJ6_9ACTN|nr:patatin-like phospholipase family protein [Nocardioides humi]
MTTLVAALAERRASGSGPGQRSDGLRIALAIEGGGNRAAYSAGMALALDEAGLTRAFDDVYGTSGGALNAAGTRRSDQRAAPPSRVERVLLAPYFLRHGRAAGVAHVGRHRTYAEDDLRLAEGTSAEVPTLVEVRPPPGSPDVARLTSDLGAIDTATEHGRSAMNAFLDRLPG